jgi:hypothetical protein
VSLAAINDITTFDDMEDDMEDDMGDDIEGDMGDDSETPRLITYQTSPTSHY